MTLTTMTLQITKSLTSVLLNGKECKDSMHYELADPASLYKTLCESLDNETEETFSTEVEVCSYEKDEPQDSKKIVREIYAVTFHPHPSWGLKGMIKHPSLGDFRFYLEFCRDAE